MCDYREAREKWEWATLAPYASHCSDPSLIWRRSDQGPRRNRPAGSHFPSTVPPEQGKDPTGGLSRFKTAFQIDRERIMCSNAFRRLEYKTQMFVTHVGDHYRTRLTHSVEVAETAKFIAQALRLNEDLVEAIALAHDLGHTPFGHNGERALDSLFKEYWPKGEPLGRNAPGPAFYHNVHGVRVVDVLEKGYDWDTRAVNLKYDLNHPVSARGRGIDPTWAVREGVLKHSSRGLRTGDRRMYGSEYLMKELEPSKPATLEGQVVEFADEITSLFHDIEDGLRGKLLSPSDIQKIIRDNVRENELPDMLGLTERFGHNPMDRGHQPRLAKLAETLKIIRNEDYHADRTYGVVLAFLRTLFLSNLIETTHWRIVSVLAGAPLSGHLPAPEENTAKAGDDERVWFDIKVLPDERREKERQSYCPEAWRVQRMNRRVNALVFSKTGEKVALSRKGAAPEAKIVWLMKSTLPEKSQWVEVTWPDSRGKKLYRLQNVGVTFTGAKLVGYDEKFLGIRRAFREVLIPEKLHNAPPVVRLNSKGSRFMAEVFRTYFELPAAIHRSALTRFGMGGQATKAPDLLRKKRAFVLRLVEHIQGMTDRYLTQEWERLFHPDSEVNESDEVSMVEGGDPPFPKC